MANANFNKIFGDRRAFTGHLRNKSYVYKASTGLHHVSDSDVVMQDISNRSIKLRDVGYLSLDYL